MAKEKNNESIKWWRGWGATRTHIYCCWEYRMIKTTLENVFQKLSTKYLITQQSYSEIFMQEKWRHKSIKKTLHKNVDSSITHNSQTLEKDQMPINKKINKLWYIHTMKWYSGEKKWDKLRTRSNLDESLKKCAEWKKSDPKVHTVQFHLYEILEYAK